MMLSYLSVLFSIFYFLPYFLSLTFFFFFFNLPRSSFLTHFVFSLSSRLPSGHKFSWTWGVDAAASGRCVSTVHHAGSRGPWHWTWPVAMVGGAHLPEWSPGWDNHQQRLQLQPWAPCLPGFCISAARPRWAPHTHHPRFHQPWGLWGGHCWPALPSQS